MPIIRPDAAWAADAFVVASLVTAAAPPALMNLVMWTGADDLESQLQAARNSTGIGVLLWGIAADFYPTRRLFLVAGLLQLPATGVLWVLDSLSASEIGGSALGLAHSGLVCLPWVLMADLLPTRHFAKIAVAITLVGGSLESTLGSLSMGLASTVWDFNVPHWILLAGGIIIAFVASRLPRPLPTEILVR